MHPGARLLLLAPLLALPACGGADHHMPGDSTDHRPFAEIAADERLHFTGTEPFWSGEVAGGTLTYQTPEDMPGQSVTVSRFAGRGGLSFSGTFGAGSTAGKALLIVFTPGDCSDGMSDRHYPLVVTLQLGEETRIGCGWSDRHPASDPPAAPQPGA